MITIEAAFRMGGYFAYRLYLCQKRRPSFGHSEPVVPLSSKIVGRKSRRLRQDVDERWLMSYAAALGDTAPCYMDTTNELSAHPLFPVCLEWPVILDGRQIEDSEMSSDELARGVHATHDVIIHRPLRPGTYFTDSTIVGVEQRRPGAFQTTRLDTFDVDGEPCVTTYQGGLFRGVSVDGEDRVIVTPPDRPAPPETEPSGPCVAVEVAAGLAHTYTECARIWNPIHTDRAVALAAGLPDIILHGTATLALAVSAIVDGLLGGDPRRVRRIAGRFAGMVLMPATLSVQVTVQTEAGTFFDVRIDEQTVIREGFLGT